MWMTHEEIRTSYRDALHKREQIEILAQLNNCCEEEIADILGVPFKRRKGRIIAWTDSMIATLANLSHQGYSDREIGEILEISQMSVRNKRFSLNIQKPKRRKSLNR